MVASQVVADQTGLAIRHTTTHDHYDFLACSSDGRIHAFFEVKKRNITTQKYSTIYLSEHKYRDCMQLSKDTGLPVFFVVLLNDGIFFTPLTQELGALITPIGREAYHLTISCNAQRQDLADVEPMVQIPVRKFIPINQINHAIQRPQ